MNCEICKKNSDEYNFSISSFDETGNSLYEYDVSICEECAAKIAEFVDTLWNKE